MTSLCIMKRGSNEIFSFPLACPIVVTTATAVGLYCHILRPCQHNDGYIDGQSQIQVYTEERTQVHSAQSSLVVIQVLTEVDVRAFYLQKNVPLS